MTRYLDLGEVLSIHAQMLELYGGSEGIKDLGALESALAQPMQEVFGSELHPTLFDKAAAYLFYLACSHAFQDGNKRVAAATSMAFLEMNQVMVVLSEGELERLTLDVVSHKLDRHGAAAFLLARTKGLSLMPQVEH